MGYTRNAMVLAGVIIGVLLACVTLNWLSNQADAHSIEPGDQGVVVIDDIPPEFRPVVKYVPVTRAEQIELMRECWEDAKKVNRVFLLQVRGAVAFFEYRIYQNPRGVER